MAVNTVGSALAPLCQIKYTAVVVHAVSRCSIIAVKGDPRVSITYIPYCSDQKINVPTKGLGEVVLGYPKLCEIWKRISLHYNWVRTSKIGLGFENTRFRPERVRIGVIWRERVDRKSDLKPCKVKARSHCFCHIVLKWLA